MGGPGSGNWYRHEKKSTVEDALAFAIHDLRGRIVPNYFGTCTWTWRGGAQSTIGFFVSYDTGEPVITLHYRWQDREDVRIPIRLQTTPTNFNGTRLWFTCPLVVNGVACNRRAGKLFLPPGARYFGCRTCHDLRYRSSQEAHQDERLFARVLGRPVGAREIRALTKSLRIGR
jgi:hypothetical protein